MDHGDHLPQSSDQETEKPRGLFVRIKIPKTNDQAGGVHDDSGRDDHVCHFCSKKFSSGKALGGHIRVHVKANRTGRRKKEQSLRPKVAAEARIETKVRSGDGTMIKCCLCSKEFRSMKSLFGHMRNHPERGWRGIHPPAGDKNNNSCCSSVSENDITMEVDQKKIDPDPLKAAIPKQPEMFKKRRRIEMVSDEVPEAAYCLMKLATSGQYVDLGKSITRNPNSCYDDEEKDQILKGRGKEKKRKMGKTPRKMKLEFDLNQPYVALDEEGTIEDQI